mmetsp:Transcript_25968/g.38368  ORF Transcript_25968/g.38368 Transcript_25968/m.38368 type:complete len:330 (-) Transcript_25968:8-997(-)|eukprot:CAMPEP_0194239656 /NCGR_PEP_ID=MMETSP0158-20130606/6056_1 /TAXON_ID=33649 /ORGANISM="Thalassionema nitzschioides, Strain L26-B" /LENGTH=329 /DNA_ID=CAMNT_0038974179 /DNA_START=161 /DNA_END=1150 /DNA_ORIENTATION=-
MRLLHYEDGAVEIVLDVKADKDKNATRSTTRVKKSKDRKRASNQLQESRDERSAIQEGSVEEKQRDIKSMQAHNKQKSLGYTGLLTEEICATEIEYTSRRKREKEKKQAAVVVIQCMARKSASKSHLKTLRQEAHVASLRKKMQAIFVLQRAIRSFLLKRQQDRSAVIMQCRTRRSLAINRATSLREAKQQETSAIAIQSVIRCFLAKTTFVVKCNEAKKHKGQRRLWSLLNLVIIVFLTVASCEIHTGTRLDAFGLAFKQSTNTIVNKAWLKSLEVFEDINAYESVLTIPASSAENVSNKHNIKKENSSKTKGEITFWERILKAFQTK